ncbi:YybH family protein [Inquilinus limosus]|uniref:DUF4440 domain-containing protein n=1 Tax=Inquilinus limosus MP06 TaxID=1398085 RepID=A0A0A0DA36_9PROT|nr:SgcJ/EcaC family oxidoreductase [Inquilinus limosus]KGM33827.1 hypothetical protein P409_13640 [Inquilinus limosus MP06]
MTIRLPFAAFMLGMSLSLAAVAATPEEDLASARPEIDKANADWVPALQAGDVQKAAEPFADDAMFILGNGKTYTGRAAIEAFLKERMTPGTKITGGTIQQDGIQVIRDGLIYEWGHGGTTKVDAQGKSQTSSGLYLTVWQRGASGHWQIIRNLNF